jgi:YesN/AraC family two-component response regulator
MPEMNGSEAFYKFKEIDMNCKIIISSGFTNYNSLNELKESGLSGFILKPYKNYELSQLIANILNE